MSFTRITGGPINFYEDYTVTNMYVERTFGGNINTITITNDSTSDPITVSYNGAILEGDIKAGETMTFNVNSKSSVFIKGTAGGDQARIFGW